MIPFNNSLFHFQVDKSGTGNWLRYLSFVAGHHVIIGSANENKPVECSSEGGNTYQTRLMFNQYNGWPTIV